MSGPSELAITIATLPNRFAHAEDEWRYATEVRARLALLGFDVLTQQVAAWLGRMSRVDSPWVERREAPFGGGGLQYRVTRFGLNDLENRLSVYVLDRAKFIPRNANEAAS